MRNLKFISEKTASNSIDISVLLLCALGAWLGFCMPANGQTVGELTTTMNVQQKMTEQGAQTPPNVAQLGEANEPLRSAEEPNKKAENTPAMSEPPAKSEPDNEEPDLTQAPEAPEVPEINDFNSFQRELSRINIETRSEETQWLGRLERKAELAKAIDDLVAAQLRFIRKIAETEQAEQSVKAIDLVLKQRQERLDKLVTKLQDELKEERQQQSDRRGRATRTGAAVQEPSQNKERPARRQRAETPPE